jgi:hypothetical protein
MLAAKWLSEVVRGDEPRACSAAHLVLGTPITPRFPEGTEQAIFGMGCFWGADSPSDSWIRLPGQPPCKAREGNKAKDTAFVRRLALMEGAAAMDSSRWHK